MVRKIRSEVLASSRETGKEMVPPVVVNSHILLLSTVMFLTYVLD